MSPNPSRHIIGQAESPSRKGKIRPGLGGANCLGHRRCWLGSGLSDGNRATKANSLSF